MKDGLRFVDSDMHIMEPPDLFERYLDPGFRDRVLGADGRPRRGTIVVDGLPTTMDAELQQYRKRSGAGGKAQSTQPLSGSRLQDSDRLDFAIQRDYDPEAQVMAMAMEGVDIAVLYPTTGLSLIARDNLDPPLSLALCQAYNNWIHEFCQYSPERLRFVAMLPVHDVHLACRELVRCVRELGAVGSFIRPNLVNGHFWHSNYWDPLYTVHEELDVAWGFHEGTGAWYSHMNTLYGENRFYRHVASHWIEMQQALIAMIVGGVFEFHPKLRVGFLEAQNSWAPGLLSRIEWDYPQYRDSHAPYLNLLPREYFRRNCWAAVEGSEPEIEATAGLIGADRMCVSTDYPHFDSNFPNVSDNLLKSCSRETAARIFMGGGYLYGLTEVDFRKADSVAARGALAPHGRSSELLRPGLHEPWASPRKDGGAHRRAPAGAGRRRPSRE
jgi:predicted TIM-barrel fold metal-dependent hydrolase